MEAHNKMSAVQKRLEEFAEHVKENKNKTFTFKLIKGNTRRGGRIIQKKKDYLVYLLQVSWIVLS